MDTKKRFEWVEGRYVEVFDTNDNGEGEGSGPATCCGGREADGAGDFDRRGERRVAPGEAEAIERYCVEVAACNEAIARKYHKEGKKQLATYYLGIAAGWQTAAVVIPTMITRLPKPDSEGSFSERSGRCNVKHTHPQTNGQ